MKNYKVIATRCFKDSNEIDEETGLKKERQVNDEFYCTKERYEYLKSKNAVELVKVIQEEKEKNEKEQFFSKEETDELVQEIITKKKRKSSKK